MSDNPCNHLARMDQWFLEDTSWYSTTDMSWLSRFDHSIQCFPFLWLMVKRSQVRLHWCRQPYANPPKCSCWRPSI